MFFFLGGGDLILGSVDISFPPCCLHVASILTGVNIKLKKYDDIKVLRFLYLHFFEWTFLNAIFQIHLGILDIKSRNFQTAVFFVMFFCWSSWSEST